MVVADADSVTFYGDILGDIESLICGTHIIWDCEMSLNLNPVVAILLVAAADGGAAAGCG